jgi:hypothetical protein
MVEKIQNIWQRLISNWNVRSVGLTMLVSALLIAVLGYFNQHSNLLVPLPIVADFYANISTELVSIAVTVLVIDALNERRAIQQEKANLILQMSSPTNSIAKEAVRVLRMRGWLTDGTLKGANLQRANLRNAFLEKADLRGIFFYEADLQGAFLQWCNLEGARKLENEQMAQLKFFRGAILPDGTTYNGRFNLPGDLKWARDTKKIALDDHQAMADFYGVSLEDYLQGQAWAQANLSNFFGRHKQPG